MIILNNLRRVFKQENNLGFDTNVNLTNIKFGEVELTSNLKNEVELLALNFLAFHTILHSILGQNFNHRGKNLIATIQIAI